MGIFSLALMKKLTQTPPSTIMLQGVKIFQRFHSNFIKDAEELYKSTPLEGYSIKTITCPSSDDGKTCDIVFLPVRHSYHGSIEAVAKFIHTLTPDMVFLELDRDKIMEYEMSESKDDFEGEFYTALRILQSPYYREKKKTKLAYTDLKPKEMLRVQRLNYMYLMKMYPNLHERFLYHLADELAWLSIREELMLERILRAAQGQESLLAITGANHLEGFIKYWKSRSINLQSPATRINNYLQYLKDIQLTKGKCFWSYLGRATYEDHVVELLSIHKWHERYPSLSMGDRCSSLYSELQQTDAEIHDIMEKERTLQFISLNLDCFENYPSKAVLEALGSCLTNKYSEGSTDRSEYISEVKHLNQQLSQQQKGLPVVDLQGRKWRELEFLCQQRALTAFSLDRMKWGVNTKPLHGSFTNFAVYSALLKQNESILCLFQSCEDRLPHGSITADTPILHEKIYYPLAVSGLIDYEMLEKTALVKKPRIIVAGGSAYPFVIDYHRLRKIADAIGAFVMIDMTYTSGLIAASVLASPFQFADVVTCTSQQSLQGPRAGFIFFKKEDVLGICLESAIYEAVQVQSSLQGCPTKNTTAALAVCLKQAAASNFCNYQIQVVANCRTLAERLAFHGHKVISGGSDNHLVVIDLIQYGITGAELEQLLDMACVIVNRISVPGQPDPLIPLGICIGCAAMTTRGLCEKEFVQIADIIHEGVQISLEVRKVVLQTRERLNLVLSSNSDVIKWVKKLQEKVESLAIAYPIPEV